MLAERLLPYPMPVLMPPVEAVRRKPSAGLGQWRSVAAGQVIHDVDTPADRVYTIVTGEVRLLEDGPNGCARLVEIFGPGDRLGAAALAGLPACGKRAVAVSDVTLVERLAHEYLLWLEQNPPEAIAVLRDLAARLHATRLRASRFVFDDCQGRVVKTLIDFAKTAAAIPLGGGAVRLHITHRNLAQAIGVARETVSVALSKLRKRGLVRTGRSRLTFVPADLQAVLTDAGELRCVEA